jgi:hypothetical protein
MPRRKVRNAVAVLQLLGDVEAVEEHHAGSALRGAVRVGMHQQRRQAGVPVRHLDRLDAGMLEHAGGVLEQLHRPCVDLHAARRARVNEALAGLVIARCAQEARRGGALMPARVRLVAAGLDRLSHARPLLEPGMVVSNMAFERASHPMHLVDLDAGPGRSPQANEQPHGPPIIVGKIEKGGIVRPPDHWPHWLVADSAGWDTNFTSTQGSLASIRTKAMRQGSLPRLTQA